LIVAQVHQLIAACEAIKKKHGDYLVGALSGRRRALNLDAVTDHVCGELLPFCTHCAASSAPVDE
jgi:hypothetical protein